MPKSTRGFLILSLFLAVTAAGIRTGSAQELVTNGGFESGTTGWALFVPEESQGKNCRFDTVAESPHSGANCLRLQSDDFARFGIGAPVFSVQPGDHYRVTAWVRADGAAQVRPKAPGFAIRLNLLQNNADAAGGHIYIQPGNAISRGNAPADSSAPLPTEWTKVEVVLEIPAGVDSVGPSLFSWWVNGSLFVDDFSIQKVDASVPVTPMSASNP
jgi:hypothetical protein